MKLYTPRGVRDLLPREAAQKQELEARLAQVFGRWGYAPIATPTFELLDIVGLGNGLGLDDKLYRFVDREGDLLALRPELTTPIARLVASRLADAPKPLRLQYNGSVFRHDEPQSGRLREFTQAGVELIGAPGPDADAEVIALAVTALTELGLTGVRIDVGHVGFTQAVLDGLELPPSTLQQVRGYLLDQDYVGLEEALAHSGVDPKRQVDVLRLVDLRGDARVLDDASDLARSHAAEAALENLREVYRLLEAHGVAGWVRIDLGMVKHLDYYTGVILEGYTADLGFSLCTGGRYDGLIERFGHPTAATGLALGVERFLLALERGGAAWETPPGRTLFVMTERRKSEAFSAAWRLRRLGRTVQLDVLGLGRTESVAYAEAEGIARVVYFAGEPGDPLQIAENGHWRTAPATELAAEGGEGV